MSDRKTIRTASIGRYSEGTVNRLGAQRNTKNVNGQLQTRFENGTGSEKAVDISSINFSSNNLIIDSYNIMDFEVAFSYFENRGSSKSVAESMSMIVMDVSKMNKIPLDVILDVLNEDPVTFGRIKSNAINSMNKLRSQSQQHLLVRDTNNSKSFRYRLVKP